LITSCNKRVYPQWGHVTKITQNNQELASEVAFHVILSGKALHNVVDADKPGLEAFKTLWKKINTKIEPPLE
jgi:hypothetical protein